MLREGEESTQSPATVPVVKAVALSLFHVPDLVRYGSKPSRDLRNDPGLLARLTAHRRTYEQVVASRHWTGFAKKPVYRKVHRPARLVSTDLSRMHDASCEEDFGYREMRSYA